jgi:uncharacterized membrane protein YkvA (DUF1232 family)
LSVPDWERFAVALLVVSAIYGAFVLWLVLAGRRNHALALALFVPDCIVLFSRLMRDARVSRRSKVGLGLVAAYLAMPVDLIPDFIPIAGQLDDAILVILALRGLLRAGGRDVITELWPGPDVSLRVLLGNATPR